MFGRQERGGMLGEGWPRYGIGICHEHLQGAEPLEEMMRVLTGRRPGVPLSNR